MLQKLEQLIFYLFVFAIPFQTRLIIGRWTPWGNYSLKIGNPPFNEWASGFLYATDLFVISLLLLWLVRAIRHGTWRWPHFSAKDFLLGAFFIISALSLVSAHILPISLYRLVKLLEYIGLYYYVKTNFAILFSYEVLLVSFTASALFQSCLAIAQSLKQGSLGLRLLGESTLAINMSGVAVFIVNGQKFMRAYGATPHPNVLAFFLFLALFALTARSLASKSIALPSILVKLYPAAYVITLWAFLLTFSRTTIALWVVSFGGLVCIAFYKNFWRRARLPPAFIELVMLSGLTLVLFTSLYWPQTLARLIISSSEEAVTQRVFYGKVAASVTVAHPIMGIGLGQFVADLMTKFPGYPAGLYQPAHNVYLLISSETGSVSLLVFGLFLLASLRDWRALMGKNTLLFLIPVLVLISIGAMGAVDHYWWTLQQGSLLFWLVLAFFEIIKKPKPLL